MSTATTDRPPYRTIGAHVPREMVEALDAKAEELEQSRSATVAEAIERMVGSAAGEVEIRIDSTNGGRYVSGEVYGLWAVTPGIGTNAGRFVITHVPTGMTAGAASFRSKEDARLAAKRMAREFSGESWTFTNPAGLAKVRPEDQKRMSRILAAYGAAKA